jgi:hypothetical protein
MCFNFMRYQIIFIKNYSAGIIRKQKRRNLSYLFVF